MNVFVRFAPFHRTIDPLTKFVPFTVRVKAGEPGMAEAGVRLVIVGTGFACSIEKAAALEVPPPGAGLNTVTLAVPAAVRSPAGIAAVSWVPPMNVVVRFAPFQRTTDPLTKFVPVTARVKAGEPTADEEGLRLVIVGVGLVATIVKETALEDPPPGAGLNTVTVAVPVVPISSAEIAAVNCVLLTKVVGRFSAFQRTTDPLTKFVPMTARVKAGEPAVAVAGSREVIVGTGLVGAGPITKFTGLEVPPPGAGLNTVMLAVPD